MHILVLGGAGYIGSVLCQQGVLERSCRVTCIDNLMYDQGQTQAHLLGRYSYQFDRRDVRDIVSYRATLASADVVVNLAALVGAPICDMRQKEAQEVNADFVRRLVKELSPNQQLIYPNTNSGYGTVPDGVCTEETPLNPVSLYGRSKLEGENYALEHHASTVFRLATVFGVSPRMRLDLLVNTMAWQGYFDKELQVFDAGMRRNYVHVQDVANVFFGAMTNKQMYQQVYNLGNDSVNMTKLQLADAIAQHTGARVVETAGMDPDRRDYEVSSQKLCYRMVLRLRTLDYGLAELVQWFSMLPQDRAVRLAIWNQMRNF